MELTRRRILKAVAGAMMAAALPFVPSIARKEWGGRVVLVGKFPEPERWYMSKRCSLEDWDSQYPKWKNRIAEDNRTTQECVLTYARDQQRVAARLMRQDVEGWAYWSPADA